nr:hypothetical protein pmam_26 [Pithovirus mammoth]
MVGKTKSKLEFFFIVALKTRKKNLEFGKICSKTCF